MQGNADYSPPPTSSFYIFSRTQGGTIDCLDVTIFDDPIREGTENFTGLLTGVRTGARVVPNIPRLTILPRQTTIEITDNDGKLIFQSSNECHQRHAKPSKAKYTLDSHSQSYSLSSHRSMYSA